MTETARDEADRAVNMRFIEQWDWWARRRARPFPCEPCRRQLHSDCVLPCHCPHRESKLSEGGDEVALTKHGTGEILPEPDDSQKVAKANWTEEDAKALAKENDDDAADAE